MLHLSTQVDVVRPSLRSNGSAAASYAKRPGQSESFIDPVSATLTKVPLPFQHSSIAWLMSLDRATAHGVWKANLASLGLKARPSNVLMSDQHGLTISLDPHSAH